MKRLALTGSIGMGKSTVSKMFAACGAAVWDADAAVHRLYGPGGAGVEPIRRLAPGAVRGGAVDRAALRALVLADPALLKRVEAAIHPLVGDDRAEAIAAAEAAGAPVIVLDIPLLFETGGAAGYDAVIVVSAPAAAQRERVLARPGMTEAAFEGILAKQTPDAEKRARADFVVDTGGALDETRRQVEAIMDWAMNGADDNA